MVDLAEAYLQKRRLEQRVMGRLRERGYHVFRLQGHPSGLIAVRKGELLLVKCRVSGRWVEEARMGWRSLAEELGAKALIAYKKRRKITLEEL
jgi:predicted transcriptional regulator